MAVVALQGECFVFFFSDTKILFVIFFYVLFLKNNIETFSFSHFISFYMNVYLHFSLSLSLLHHNQCSETKSQAPGHVVQRMREEPITSCWKC